jgi:hypothetical protein
MPNTKKSQWATWVSDTATLRASLNPTDPHEQALFRFLRQVEKELVRVQSDRDKG